MRVVLDGALPSWVAACTEQELRDRVGASAYARGVSYALERAVLTLSSQGDGELLNATVRGSGERDYDTVVRAVPASATARSSIDWAGYCSCPVQIDCKHVAAVLVTARRWLDRAPVAVISSWEVELDEVVRPSAPEVALAELALELDVVTTPRQRYGRSDTSAQRLRLRPVTLGRSGRWIRSGVSWRELQSGSGPVKVRPDHRELARTILATFHAHQPPYAPAYGEAQVHLDDLGASGWRLLAEAQEAGIELRGARTGQVVQRGQPATVLVTVRRSGPQADIDLAPRIRLPGEPDLAPHEAVLVGRPAHGLFVTTSERLLLAPFDRPPDAGTQRLLEQTGVRIPAADLPRFFTRYYPALRQRVAVECSDDSVALPEIAPPALALDVHFEAGHRTALSWAFAYPTGDTAVRVPLDGDTDRVVRDRPAEQALLAGIQALPELPGVRHDAAGRSHLGDIVLTGLETARFAEHWLPALTDHEGVVVQVSGTPAAYAEAAEAPLVSVSARDSADPQADWFDLDLTVTVSGQQVPLASLITALALDQPHLLLDSGTWFRLDRPELHALRRLVEEARSLQDRDSTGLRVTPYQAGLWEELVSLGVVEHQSERWTRTVGALLALDEVPHPEPPRKLQATLRAYQLDGYRWLSLLWDHRLGGILADDMGLGKTLQTLAMAARAYEQGTLGGDAGPLLVVAPTSVVATWASEAARFCPDLAVVTITETERRSGLSLAEAAAGADLVVTSYALLRIEEEAYRALRWSGLVLDEAQFVKNHQAKTYQCARRLPAPVKLAITGTPLENSLMDLWSMLSITAPGLFPNPQRFTEMYRRPIESGESPERLATLRRRIRPLMLRRTKDQVATDLPAKTEQVLEVTLNPQHRRVYDKHLARERQRVLGLLDDLQKNRIAILRSLTVLRQLSLAASLVDAEHAGIRSSKIDALMEQLQEVVAEGHRVLVFSQFTGFLALVRTRLAEAGLGHCYLDGRTRDRPRRIAQWRDGDAPVFLISLKAGGVGLTLTEADYVFVLDPWWNPATEAQAIDRTHRIGQTKPVVVYRLVASDTIEEKVVALQQRKRDLFARVVGGDEMVPAALTAADIRGLFA